LLVCRQAHPGHLPAKNAAKRTAGTIAAKRHGRQRTGPRTCGVIFDMDGVIVDSEPLSLATIAEVVTEGGGHADPAGYGDLVGRSLDDALMLAAAWSGRDLPVDDLRAAYDERYLPKLRNTAVPNAGLTELISALRAARVPMALASSSRLAEIDAIVAAFDIGDVLAAVASGEEVRRAKPAPDVYVLAMAGLGAGTGGVVAIEDSALGIAAASAARLACVALRTTMTTSHDLGAATLTVGSLTELDLEVLDRIAARDGDDDH
jgi:HAD superfamily hydrolase (TIGR01509 family)